MIVELLALWKSLLSLAPDAFVKCIFVFVSIFCLRLVKVLPNGKWARAANIVFATLLSGVTTTAKPEDLYMFAMVSSFSATVFELAERLWKRVGVRVQVNPA